MELGLNAEQGHGAEVHGKELVLCPVASGEPPELAGWQSGRNFSKLAYLASQVNTNLWSLSREGAVQ